MKKSFTGKEFKELIYETAGVPDNILETSDLLYSKIVEYLTNNRNEPINMSAEFVVDGDFIIGKLPETGENDFITNQIKVVIKIKNIRPITDIGFVGAGHESKTELASNFRIKELKFSVENHSINFDFEYSAKYKIQFIHLLKYFNNNTDYIKSVIAHELKHVYDGFKKPVTHINTNADYKSYEYNANIPPVNNLIYAMYYTSNFERTVKNSEFYTTLTLKLIKKSEFNNFLNNSEEYQVVKKMRDLTFEKLINSMKTTYYGEVKNFLILAGFKPEMYSVDQNIDKVFELVYLGINKLKLEYLSKFLLNTSKPIISDIKKNYDYYKKEEENNFDVDYIKYFKDKIRDINKRADVMIHQIGKLYILLTEEGFNPNLHINSTQRLRNSIKFFSNDL